MMQSENNFARCPRPCWPIWLVCI